MPTNLAAIKSQSKVQLINATNVQQHTTTTTTSLPSTPTTPNLNQMSNDLLE
jgi:hypothetical protein